MKASGKIKATFVVPLLLTFVFSFLTIQNPPVIDEFLEALLVDYRFKVRNFISPPPVPDNIIIVTVDEKSLQERGRWPWKRSLQADLIEKVFVGSPRAVGVDVFYPEPETPETDGALAQVFEAHRGSLIIGLGFEAEKDRKYNGEIDDVLYDFTISRIENISLVSSVNTYRALLPHEPIKSAAEYGHVYSLADRDGKLRWEYLYIQYGDEYFPSLALQVTRAALSVPLDKVTIFGAQGVALDSVFIPTDMFGRMHINYLGKERTFPYISATDVLSGAISPGVFKDKIVLIGTSALSIYDLKNTPFSANMPGVEKHATIIANILGNNFIRKAPLYIDVLAVLLAGAAALLMGLRMRALQSFILYDILLALILISNQAAFTFTGLRVNLVYPLLTVLTAGTFIISYRYLIEERRAREIRRLFSSYVTERVVNELIRNPEMARLGGARREVTVLFSDVCGFTTYSEKHAPEDVVSILNEYLTAMTEVIFRWEGTLDKFIGDAIVAFWGAPLRQENHAELAVRCALHMIKRLQELQKKWIAEGKTPLSMGIGINTGEVLVGNIGAEGKKMDYTVIGDQVNIGSRVESLTRQFSTNILMTEMPLKAIEEMVQSNRIGHVSIRGVATVVVKGKEKPVKIYEISSLPDSERSEITECSEGEVLHMKEK